MKPFAERNPYRLGAGGIAVAAAITVGVLEYDKLPIINQTHEYSAYFADAGGLRTGAAVQVSGLRVGKVSEIDLEGAQVLVRFEVADDVELGERTEAAITTKSVLGAKILDIRPRGDGRLDDVIPLNRTTSPYQLPDALGDLSTTIGGLDTNQVSESLQTLAQTFQDSPPDLRAAVEGVAQFSESLNRRDSQLRSLLTNANIATSVLAKRTDQIAGLISDSNTLMAELQTESGALDQLSARLSVLSQQLSGFVADNRQTLKPALDKLNGVLALVDNRKDQVKKFLSLAPGVLTRLGEAVASGPFFKAYVVNLLPGQFVQPFVDAAFSDLGLDPNVLSPSQLNDPQTGQPGTPALPVPFPRTGQGGEPHLTLPDAITGKPGDPRYPYREPSPAPPSGGPPPGPPAPPPPGMSSVAEPIPSPVHVTAPNEAPPAPGARNSVGSVGQPRGGQP